MENLEVYSVKKTKKDSKTDKEISGKDFESLSIIAQRIGGDFGMKVKIGEPGNGSFFNTEEISITLDPLHIEENPNMAKFVVAHEGGHRAITRSPRELGLPNETVEQLYSQIGFGFTQNAIEDAADNTWIATNFPGMEGYIKENYDAAFSEENATLGTPEVQQLASQLGYWPKFAQYGSEVIRYWHQKRFSKKLDPKVDKVLKKTIKDAKLSFSLIPKAEKIGEQEIIKKARQRFAFNTKNIWPHVKELVDDDFNNEKQRQAAQDIHDQMQDMKQKEGEKKAAQEAGNSEAEQELQKQIDQMKKNLEASGFSEEMLEELEKKIEEAIKKAKEQKNKGVGEGGKDGKESKGEKGEGEEEQQQGEGQGGDKEDEAGSQGSGFGTPIPIDKLSEELKKKLQEYFDKLPKNKQKEIEDKAKEILKKFEDEINKDLEGKLNKDKTENHEQREEKESQKKQSMKDAALKSKEADAEEQRKIEKLRKLREEMMSDYEKQRAEVVGLIDYLYLRLRRILKPEEYGGQESGYSSGQIVDMTRAMQAERDVVQKQKMWIRETSPERKDYRFWHLVDLSGSMDGAAIKEAFKGFVVSSEAIDRVEDFNSVSVNIHQGITGFHNRVFKYKNYRERFTKTLEDRLSEMLKRPNDDDAGTNTYKGTFVALENLSKDLGSTGNFLLTFTDGAPNHDVRDELKKLIKKTKEEREKKKIKMGIVWLGDSEDSLKALIKEYGYDFGLVMSIKPTKEGKNFAESLADLMEDIVKNPDKY